MQTIPTTISKNWFETLTKTEGIDRATAKTIVTTVIGDPRLMLDSVSSPEDIEFATRVAYEDLGQFDVSEIEVSDQEWNNIRRRLVERLHENLHEQYWDQEVPIMEDTDYLYEILKRADLSSDDIVLTVESYLESEGQSVGGDEGSGETANAPVDATGPTDTAGFASPGTAKLQEILEEHDKEAEEEQEGDGPSPDGVDESSSNLSGGYASRENVSDILGEDDENEDDDDVEDDDDSKSSEE